MTTPRPQIDFKVLFDADLDQVDISAYEGLEQIGYMWVDNVSTRPTVGYANTGPNVYRGIRDNRRRGVGTQLYIFALVWLINNNHTGELFASPVQSRDAKSLWTSLTNKGWVSQIDGCAYLDAKLIS